MKCVSVCYKHSVSRLATLMSQRPPGACTHGVPHRLGCCRPLVGKPRQQGSKEHSITGYTEHHQCPAEPLSLPPWPPPVNPCQAATATDRTPGAPEWHRHGVTPLHAAGVEWGHTVLVPIQGSRPGGSVLGQGAARSEGCLLLAEQRQHPGLGHQLSRWPVSAAAAARQLGELCCRVGWGVAYAWPSLPPSSRCRARAWQEMHPELIVSAVGKRTGGADP